ncbi:MAG TPA: DUF308 domain-containing protein [Acidimicrobiales bacterium]|nr:DUF308 domain-containing protein [Acidimicrobiales bacterium]
MADVVDTESNDILEVVGRSWAWVLFFGFASVIAGAIVVAWPKETAYAFAIAVGIWLFVSGLVRIIMAIADSKNTGGSRFLMAFLGLLSVLVGLFFVRHTFETIGTLGFLIGIFWVIGGLIEFFSAYGDKGSPGRGWRLIMGTLGFAAGIVTLAYPHMTVSILATIMGIWLIVFGLLQALLSFQIRKLAA